MGKSDTHIYHIATLTQSLIYRANYGERPQTREDWQTVCERLLCTLSIERTRGTERGILIGTEITVKDTHNENRLSHTIAHEVAEYLLASEWEAPYNYPPSWGDIRHTIAEIVQHSV